MRVWWDEDDLEFKSPFNPVTLGLVAVSWAIIGLIVWAFA